MVTSRRRMRPLLACLIVGLTQPLAATADSPPPAQPAPLTLASLEQMALAGNPTLAQAAANVEASRGRTLQSGLYPNPTVGYQGDLINVEGTAGEMQGLFIDQTIVTAGKLRLSRAKFGQEVSQMEAQALAQQYRVLNGVRTRYYQLLAMQRILDVRAVLLKNADDAVTTTEQLKNVGADNKPDALQAPWPTCWRPARSYKSPARRLRATRSV